MGIATIGVYGFDAQSFLHALRDSDVRVLIDVRQRRGVRGREYAWANARASRRRSQTPGIEYRHDKELAPTTELRELQYREDARQGAGKRSRTELAPEYVERYTREILGRSTSPRSSPSCRRRRAALLCVEADPEACHRSLVADRLAAAFGVEVAHLRRDSVS